MPRKKKTPPDPWAGMRELRDREAGQREQDDQTVSQVASEESCRDAWDQGWKKLESAIAAYLAGQSSRVMVDEISELNNLVDAVGFDGRLQRLRHGDAFPRLDSLDDAFHLVICEMVAVVWIGVRFDAADPDDLVKTLDANNDRTPIHEVAFARHFIENGGLPSCPQCGKPQAPTDILRDRCESCRRKDRTSLLALQRAIECEHRHGQGQVYTGGVEAHYPPWSSWKIRLTDYVNADDASDHDLWRIWMNYVRREHGLDKEAFLRFQINQAENLLPPEGILLAREQDSRSRTKSQDSHVIASITSFRPEECDDDLWFQLDVCIRAMESVAGAAYAVIRDWKIGTENDSKYLKNINGLAIKAGWKPFVFPRDDGLEVVRTNGEKAFCHKHRGGYRSDEIGGEAVLSALRAWREKRTDELRAIKESVVRSENAGTDAAGESKIQTDAKQLVDLAKSIDRLAESVSKSRNKRRKATQEDDHQDWEKVYRDYDAFTATKKTKSKKNGPWTARFEAFWSNRRDLQAFKLDAAWRRMEAARRRIERRSRK